MKLFKQYLSESKGAIESLDESKDAKVMFESALKARDADVEIVRATHPLSRGKHMIKVYSKMTDPNVVFYADVLDFRADYMS